MSNATRVARLLLPMFVALAAVMSWSASVASAGYRAPGGPLPLWYGGDNQSPYPAISTVGVAPPHASAVRLTLSCAPNPARGPVRFRGVIPAGGELRVRLFSVNGRLVREWKPEADGAGPVEWMWDGRDDRGRTVPPGLYFYRAEAAGRQARGKLVLLGSGR